MNKTLAVAAALALLFTVGLAPRAQAVYFSADVPVANTTEVGSDSDDLDSLSGYKLGVGNLVWWLGLGYESYTGKWKPSGSTSSIDFDYTFTDLLLDLPIPVVNITLGYGVGDIEAKFAGTKLASWDATQQFINVGIPIAAIFDVHLGYHIIKGSSNDTGTDDLDATTTTVGVRVGF